MSDKSPRQGMTKKTGKSIKEKRAEKRSKGEETSLSDKITPRSTDLLGRPEPPTTPRRAAFGSR